MSAGPSFALELLAQLIVLPLLLLTTVLCVELLFGLRPPAPANLGRGEPATTVVVVPAHNEEAGLAATLRAITGAGFAGMRILVVADNCTDDSARIAKDCGALVVERNDPTRLGKGFALACAQAHIRQMKDLPNVVIVIDADARPQANALSLLSQATIESDRPVQAHNMLTAPAEAPATVQLSNFAFFIKNGIRQRALKRLGAPALLNGTGMSFPWRLFEQAELATDSLVEDLELGVAFSAAGNLPVYLEQAVVLSEAASTEAMVNQRSRWEGGFISTARRIAPALLWDALKTGSRPKFWSGLDLLIPPLTILVFVNLSAIGVTYLISLGTGQFSACLILVSVNIVLAMLLLVCWYREGRRFLSASALISLPIYMLWKIPLYLKLLRQKPGRWIRTERN